MLNLQIDFPKLFPEFMLKFYISVIRVIKILAAIWKVGRGPIFEEVLPEHATFSFRIALNPLKWRRSLNTLFGQKYMWKIPTGQLLLIWASEGKNKWGEYKHKLGVLPVDHTLEGLFTTSLLVPSFTFKYCTFLLEFMEKDNFPQFKPLVTYEIL